MTADEIAKLREHIAEMRARASRYREDATAAAMKADLLLHEAMLLDIAVDEYEAAT